MNLKNFIFKTKLHFAKNHNRADVLRKHGVTIGKCSDISKNVFWGSEPYLIKLGDYVRIARNVTFITHDGGMWVLRNLHKLDNADKFGPIIIKDNVHIGMNVTIMPGVTIGSNCIIGCGAIVTKDIPDNSIAVGIPARVIETTDEYYEKNKDNVDYTKNMTASQKKEYLLEKYNLNN